MEKIRLLGTGIIICLLMMFVSSVNAQKYKSVFKNLTWEQAAELAQKEGKIVFVDAMRKAGGSEEAGCRRTEIVFNFGNYGFL